MGTDRLGCESQAKGKGYGTLADREVCWAPELGVLLQLYWQQETSRLAYRAYICSVRSRRSSSNGTLPCPCLSSSHRLRR